jgi:hypothetical protein
MATTRRRGRHRQSGPTLTRNSPRTKVPKMNTSPGSRRPAGAGDTRRHRVVLGVLTALTAGLAGVIVVLAAGLVSGAVKALCLLAACLLVGCIVLLLPARWRTTTATFAAAFVAAAGVLPVFVSSNGSPVSPTPTTSPAGDHGSPAASATSGDLRLVDVTVRNAGPERASLEVQLHNRGARRVVIFNASVEVLRIASISQCHNQGELPLSYRYKVSLPTRPSEIHVPLHQQVGPDKADRFSLLFGFTDAALGRGPEQGGATRSYVVQLGASLRSDDGSKPLYLGQFVMAAPAVPQAVVQYWPRALEHARAADLEPTFGANFPWRSHMPCWRANTERLRSILAAGGTRSAALRNVATDLARVVVPPT